MYGAEERPGCAPFIDGLLTDRLKSKAGSCAERAQNIRFSPQGTLFSPDIKCMLIKKCILFRHRYQTADVFWVFTWNELLPPCTLLDPLVKPEYSFLSTL